jgi:hypothetical protein
MISPSGRQELSRLLSNTVSLLSRARNWSLSYRTETDVRICLRSIVLLSTWIRVRSGVVPSCLPIIFLYAFFYIPILLLIHANPNLATYLCLSPSDVNALQRELSVKHFKTELIPYRKLHYKRRVG